MEPAAPTPPPAPADSQQAWEEILHGNEGQNPPPPASDPIPSEALYSAEKATGALAKPSKKESTTMSSWTVPLVGMFAMLALSTVAALRRRRAMQNEDATYRGLTQSE